MVESASSSAQSVEFLLTAMSTVAISNGRSASEIGQTAWEPRGFGHDRLQPSISAVTCAATAFERAARARDVHRFVEGLAAVSGAQRASTIWVVVVPLGQRARAGIERHQAVLLPAIVRSHGQRAARRSRCRLRPAAEDRG